MVANLNFVIQAKPEKLYFAYSHKQVVIFHELQH